MKTAKKSTFSLMFYVKRTKPLKNGEVPICLRITVNRQYAEVMIKRSIPASLWDQKKECSKGKAYSDRELNHYLDSVKARVYLLQREYTAPVKPVYNARIGGPFLIKYYVFPKRDIVVFSLEADHPDDPRVGMATVRQPTINFEPSSGACRTLARSKKKHSPRKRRVFF